MTSISHIGDALLALCRPWWTEADEVHFRSVANEVSDWQGFGDMAAEAHVAPMVLRNLDACGFDGLPYEETAILVAATREATMRNMRNEAELRYLEKNLREAEGVDYLHVKGASLACRYYPEPSLRPHRDIDVLLSDKDRLRAILFGASNGYRFFVANRELPIKGEADEAALYAFGREVSMVSPRLAVVELHKSIDKGMDIFPPKVLFEVSEQLDLSVRNMRVLPTNWLFCYLAYHGCQHNWSRLVWMIDLVALMRAEDFSWPEAEAIAVRSGVHSMVEAAYHAALCFKEGEFNSCMSSRAKGDAKARQIVEAVLRANKLSSPQRDSNRTSALPDMSASMWIGDGLNGLRFSLNRLAELSSPSLDDYRLIPVDARRSNLHYYLRPVLFAYRRARAAFGGANRE